MSDFAFYDQILSSRGANEDIHGNLLLVGADGFHGKGGGTPPSSRSGKPGGRSSYWDGGGMVLQRFTHNDTTILVPALAPAYEEITIRTAIFNKTVSAIQEVDKPNWGWKCDVLQMRFQELMAGALNIAKDALNMITHRTSPVYSYSDCRIHAADITTELAAGPDEDFPADSRAQCRWISMTLSFSPRNCYVNGGTIDPTALPDTSSIRIFIRAPQTAGGAAGAGGLRDTLTKAALSTGAGLLGLFITYAAGIQVYAATPTNFPQTDIFERWLKNQQMKTYFFGMVQCIRHRYIGSVMATDTITQRFYALRQTVWSPQEKRMVILPITELHNQFFKLISEATDNGNGHILPELDQVFYNCLIKEHRNSQIARKLQHPASVNLNDNITRLQIIVNATMENEEHIRQMIKFSGRNTMTGRTQFRPAGSAHPPDNNTFLTTTTNPLADAPPGETEYEDLTVLGDGYGTPPTPKRAKQDSEDPHFQAVTFSDEVLRLTTPSVVQEYLVLMSNAEKAMREASGLNAPLRCWGCQGLFPDDTHLFKDCPRKDVKEVATQFHKRLLEFRVSRKQGSATFQPNRYKKLGFPTRHSVVLFNRITEEELSATDRTVLLSQLVQEFTPDAEEPRGIAGRTRAATGSGPLSDGATYAFLTWSVTASADAATGPNGIAHTDFPDRQSPLPQAFQTHPINNIAYAISRELPHVRIPVGKGKSHTIEGLLDTGGCSTLGHYPYFAKVASMHPDIVAATYELRERHMEPIRIGGIGGRIEITHVMEMWMPYIMKGHATKISIGLSEDLPITCIIGLPFIIATKVVLDADAQTAYSKLFNCTWPTSMKPPHLKPLETLDHPINGRLSFPGFEEEQE